MTTETKRIDWIDSARGVAFLMVIYYHSIYENRELMYYFFPVFLTMFFFVSGYLFKNTLSFKHLVEHRLRTLLLPFLIFGLFLIFSEILFPYKNMAPLPQRLSGFFLQIRNNYDKLWFIAALFIMNFPFYFLIKYAKSTKKLLLVSFVLFLLSTIYRYYLKLPLLPWHVQYIGFCCFYMTLGYLYRHYESRLAFLGKKGIPVALLFLYVLSMFIRQNVLHSPNINFVGSYYIFDALIISCLGIAAIIYLLKRVNRKSTLLVFIGANSLCYFALHGLILRAFHALIETLFVTYSIEHSAQIDFFIGIGLPFLVAVVLILPVMCINKYMPVIVGKGLPRFF